MKCYQCKGQGATIQFNDPWKAPTFTPCPVCSGTGKIRR